MTDFIDILKYIFLGLVQGLTEVLPISSSGHLAIVSNIMNINDDSIFLEVLLHVGSLIAVLVFLRKKLISLIKGFCLFVFKKDKEHLHEFKYCMYIVISTLVVSVFTLIFDDVVEKATSKLFIIGILLVINSMFLFVLPKIQGTRTEKELNYKDALVIGAFECLGIFPGISRSGSCLCGAFSRKIDKSTATDFAFLLFIPAAVGALLLELVHFNEIVIPSNTIHLYIIATVVSMVMTYISFVWLVKFIRKGKLNVFAYYCLVVGIFTFIYGIINK